MQNQEEAKTDEDLFADAGNLEDLMGQTEVAGTVAAAAGGNIFEQVQAELD